MRKDVGYESLRLMVAGVLSAALIVLGVLLARLSGTFTSPHGAGAAIIGIYLALPLVLTLMSVGWRGNRATGMRKFVVAGVAALLPASALVYAAALTVEGRWLALLVVVPLVLALLVTPAVLCFRAAGAIAHHDAPAAYRATRVVNPLILAPAGVIAAVTTPMALAGVAPCDLCFQSAFALIVLAAYAAPAFVAGALASSARTWAKGRALAEADHRDSLVSSAAARGGAGP